MSSGCPTCQVMEEVVWETLQTERLRARVGGRDSGTERDEDTERQRQGQRDRD